MTPIKKRHATDLHQQANSTIFFQQSYTKSRLYYPQEISTQNNVLQINQTLTSVSFADGNTLLSGLLLLSILFNEQPTIDGEDEDSSDTESVLLPSKT